MTFPNLYTNSPVDLKTFRDNHSDSDGINTMDNLRQPSAKRKRVDRSSSPQEIDPPTTTHTSIYNANLNLYKELMGDRSEGIVFLYDSCLAERLQAPLKRVAIEYETTMEAALEDFRRLIAIKVFTVDENGTKISPTPLMDELWHAAILDTKLYADLQKAIGMVLHHCPLGGSESQEVPRTKRLAVMTTLYQAFFTADPLGSGKSAGKNCKPPTDNAPEIMGVFVRGATDGLLTIYISKHATVAALKIEIEKRSGWAVDRQRLLFGGKQLEGDGLLTSYGVQKESTLMVIGRLKGC